MAEAGKPNVKLTSRGRDWHLHHRVLAQESGFFAKLWPTPPPVGSRKPKTQLNITNPR